MLFGRKKGIVSFLDKADDALNNAYFNHDIHPVIPFMTPGLLDYIAEEVATHEDLTQGLGLKKYRVREWEIVQEDNTVVVALKKITHKDVQIRGLISIPVGDNKTEEWKLQRVGSSYKVTNIRQLGGSYA